MHQKPDQMEEIRWEGQNFSEVVVSQEEEEEEEEYTTHLKYHNTFVYNMLLIVSQSLPVSNQKETLKLFLWYSFGCPYWNEYCMNLRLGSW